MRYGGSIENISIGVLAPLSKVQVLRRGWRVVNVGLSDHRHSKVTVELIVCQRVGGNLSGSDHRYGRGFCNVGARASLRNQYPWCIAVVVDNLNIHIRNIRRIPICPRDVGGGYVVDLDAPRVNPRGCANRENQFLISIQAVGSCDTQSAIAWGVGRECKRPVKLII